VVGVEAPEEGRMPCSEIIFDKRTGSRICLETGEVIEESVIGEGADNVARVGDGEGEQPLPLQHNRHDLGVGAALFASKGRGLRGSRRVRVRIKYRHSPGAPVTKTEKTLIGLLTRLEEAARVLGFPPSAHQTAAMILKCFNSKLERAPSDGEAKAMIAYALVKAAQLHSLAIERGRILSSMDLSENDSRYWSVMSNQRIRECIAHYNRKLATRRRRDPLREISPFVARLVRQLKLDEDVGRDAMAFLAKNLEAGKTFHGKKPESLAAAAVYLVAKLYGYDINQATVAQALGLKESNVRKTYRQLIAGMKIIVAV